MWATGKRPEHERQMFCYLLRFQQCSSIIFYTGFLIFFFLTKQQNCLLEKIRIRFFKFNYRKKDLPMIFDFLEMCLYVGSTYVFLFFHYLFTLLFKRLEFFFFSVKHKYCQTRLSCCLVLVSLSNWLICRYCGSMMQKSHEKETDTSINFDFFFFYRICVSIDTQWTPA